jgi:hypothetical protein
VVLWFTIANPYRFFYYAKVVGGVSTP